ncbi:MAG: hypothetical protein AAGC69_06220, partial [Paracraurococcus sp.]
EYNARLRPAGGSGEALWQRQREAVAAQRRRLAALRSAGAIGDDAFHVIEEEIDLLELSADPRVKALRAE